MKHESTLVLIKPDGVSRGLVGETLKRLESSGLTICALKLISISKKLAEIHYAEHSEKPFFNNVVSFLTSAPVVAIVLSGASAIENTRTLMGATNPVDAAPGTIRKDLGSTIEKNVMHGSANPEDAKREIELYFEHKEIINYQRRY